MSVEQDLQQIMSARYGKDVRQSIHDAIYDINEVAKRAEYDASTAPESARAYAEAALASLQAAEDAQQAAEDAAAEAMSGTPAGYADVVADVYSLKENTGTYLANSKSNIGRVLLDKMYGMSLQNGTPTPSVPVEIKSAKANFRNCSKNLIPYPFYTASGTVDNGITFTYDLSGVVTLNGTPSNANAKFLGYMWSNSILKAGKTYIFSFEIEGFANFANGASIYISINGTDIVAIRNKTANGYYEASFTATQSQAESTSMQMGLYISGATTQTLNNAKIKTMLRLSDNADSSYKEPIMQNVATDLVLRAIEVTSTDNYNLVKDGKYYVADTLEKIDGGYQITRRIGDLVLNGSEGITWGIGSNGGEISCYKLASAVFGAALPKSSATQNDKAPLLLTRYKVESFNHMNANPDLGCVALYYAISLASDTILFKTSGITTSSGFNTWLQSNNVELVYVLAAPTVETVTDANAIKLLSLKSYDEATYIAQTEDTEGVMVLEYGSTNFATKALSGYVEAESNSIRIGLLENA